MDDLIHSGADEIVLDSDITLSDDEESVYKSGIGIGVDNLVIDGAGHSIDAVGKTGIFKISSKVTLKSLTLKNGHTADGGAINIRKGGDVHITDCQFRKNAAENFGGAIYNSGDLTIGKSALNENTANDGGAVYTINGGLTIAESTFFHNAAQEDGGAISNWEGELIIDESAFSKNDAQQLGGAICNTRGELTITAAEIRQNTARWDGGAVYNTGRMMIGESSLSENASQNSAGAIKNYEGTLTLTKSSLEANTARKYGGAIVNDGEYGARVYIKETAFAGNESQGQCSAIHNAEGGELKLLDAQFDDNSVVNDGRLVVMGKFSAGQSKAVFNNGDAIIESEDVSGSIENAGNVDKLKLPNENLKDFTYLNELIRSGADEIRLEHDIVLNVRNGEDETFSEGIKIDRDDLIVDGNGHEVDAQGFARIFCCTGKNITLKNVTLKNGYAICGGSIHNRGGSLTISKSLLDKNRANTLGGAIHNNRGRLTILDSVFKYNTTGQEGGAINNADGELTVSDSTFSQNNAQWDGGALYATGMSTIRDSTFLENAAHEGFGGAICLYNSKYESENCTFRDNKPDDVYEE